ncbi:MAG: 16S rRNA (cytosine(1402)-N(4))-methyltransferase RsmH [Planctomycetota bacterium]|nr:16S rRNA (cytosine(1402)-N(4))-methyltransferase RsmH [Planctomycetota bacterium]MDP6763327.1 16S rRNA (cytosine(1402)-N(4))-methyltransferase RsmH [Planctomycetota bacterium]MDP6989453.1 16S rRNA (cytosine(1402)-N(4))-methyltransferase RsmH [Planctomycetota bacterium]
MPVLPTEVVEALVGDRPDELDGWIVDGTCGAGGHARALLEAAPRVRVLALDHDPQALDLARRNLAAFGQRVRFRRARLSELARTLRKERIGRPLGVLFDLGVCSLHLDRPERGFSFSADGPLDMRMDPDRPRTAADIVNTWDESDLADLFYFEGGESGARRIARAIVEARRRAPFQRTGGLAEIVSRAMGRAGGRTHPATRTFQALRRAVNEEGDELLGGLAAADHWLADGGRLAVISFHSGEDRSVKHFLQRGGREGRWDVLTRKPLTASGAEVRGNPRARSARLRAATRLREQRCGRSDEIARTGAP